VRRISRIASASLHDDGPREHDDPDESRDDEHCHDSERCSIFQNPSFGHDQSPFGLLLPSPSASITGQGALNALTSREPSQQRSICGVFGRSSAESKQMGSKTSSELLDSPPVMRDQSFLRNLISGLHGRYRPEIGLSKVPSTGKCTFTEP
jgi:hypothetical protein